MRKDLNPIHLSIQQNIEAVLKEGETTFDTLQEDLKLPNLKEQLADGSVTLETLSRISEYLNMPIETLFDEWRMKNERGEKENDRKIFFSLALNALIGNPSNDNLSPDDLSEKALKQADAMMKSFHKK